MASFRGMYWEYQELLKPDQDEEFRFAKETKCLTISVENKNSSPCLHIWMSCAAWTISSIVHELSNCKLYINEMIRKFYRIVRWSQYVLSPCGTRLLAVQTQDLNSLLQYCDNMQSTQRGSWESSQSIPVLSPGSWELFASKILLLKLLSSDTIIAHFWPSKWLIYDPEKISMFNK